MICASCQREIVDNSNYCYFCGARQAAGGRTGPPTAAAGSVSGAAKYPFLSAYWQVVFAKFDQNPTKFQTHWNWPALFFGAFWYLVKGMPAKAALYFALAIVTAGVGWLFLAIYAGLYGAWDYYLREVYGKQLW